MLKHSSTFTYRLIDGNYFVSHLEKQEVVVLNKSAFAILRLANKKTQDQVAGRLKKKAAFSYLNSDDISNCLQELQELGLLHQCHQ